MQCLYPLNLILQARQTYNKMSEKKSKKTKIKSCHDHPDEDLKFYCTAHNDVICSICAVKRHKLCQDTLTFPESIERFERERNNLFKALDTQSRVIDETTLQKRDALESIAPEAGQVKFKLRNLRSTVNRLIDKSESELLRKVEDIERQQTLKLAEDIENLEDLSAAAAKVKGKAHEAFDKRSDLHIITAMAKVQNTYCEIERCASVALERISGSITFEISQSIQEFIDSFDSLGTLSIVEKESVKENGTATDEGAETPKLLCLGLVSRENTSGESKSGTSGSCPSRLPSSLEDIESSSEDESSPSSDEMLASGDDNDVTVTKDSPDESDIQTDDTEELVVGGAEALSSPEIEMANLTLTDGKLLDSFVTVDHGKPCWLYGIAYLPDERLVITDVAHDSLQLYDNNYRLLSESRVSFSPWDVAAVSRNTIAVCTGGKGTINTFSVHGNDFVALKSLSVGSDCISLAYSNNVFTAGTRKGGVLIYEDGEIIARIEKNSSSREVFRRADFLAVDDESRNIFISNAWASNIVCVTPDGRKLWEKQTKGSNPRGLVWYTGRLLVASRSQHKVMTVDGDGSFVDDIVVKDLEYPYAVALHPGSKFLAVTQWDEKMSGEKSRTIKIFGF